MILVATFIAQEHSRTVVLRDQQIGGAIVVIVGSQQPTRRFQMNLVEPDFSGYIREPFGTHIAKEPNFAAPVRCFAHGG